MGEGTSSIREKCGKLREAFRIDEQSKRACSFAFTSRPVPSSWKAYTFDLPIPFYCVEAPDATITQVRSVALGIQAENYVLLAESESQMVLVLRRSKRDDNAALILSLRKEEDCERVINTIRKFNFISDELSAHSSINSVVDQLKVGAERHYTNRGLFSNHFLKERLHATLSGRGRNPPKESGTLLSKLGGAVSSNSFWHQKSANVHVQQKPSS